MTRWFSEWEMVNLKILVKSSYGDIRCTLTPSHNTTGVRTPAGYYNYNLTWFLGCAKSSQVWSRPRAQSLGHRLRVALPLYPISLVFFGCIFYSVPSFVVFRSSMTDDDVVKSCLTSYYHATHHRIWRLRTLGNLNSRWCTRFQYFTWPNKM